MPSRFKVELAAIDWKQFYWQVGARRMPAIIVLLVAGVCIHQPAAGALAAGTALSAGFAGARHVDGSRVLAMAITTFLMTACALGGTLAGNCFAMTIASVVIGGFVCGFLALASEDLGWVAMQGIIALLIGTYYPSSWGNATERAVFIFAGGAAQTLSIWFIWHLEGISGSGPETGAPGTGSDSKCENWAELFNKAISSPISVRFGLRVAITLALAVEMDHLLKLKNGYWLPMTALIVLKPDFVRTYTGGIQRVVGTLAGVVFASLMTAILHPGIVILIALAVVAGWFTFSFQKVNPVMFSAALTFYAVLLIAIAGSPESTVTWHRFINTFLGCALALVSHFVGFFIIHRSEPGSVKTPEKDPTFKS